MQSVIRYRVNRLRRSMAGKLALLSPRFHGMLPAGASFERLEYRWESEGKLEDNLEGGRLMVFLPGIDDVAEDFERRGLIEDARQHAIARGAVAVDAHYGYYAARTLHDLINKDIIAPAQSQGYRQFWMVGISLGGFGAASFAASRPDQVAGMLLLAPYLGDRTLIREIRSAGGVGRWRPGGVDEGDYPRKLWAWLKREYTAGTPRIPLYLGYGERDRFSEAHRLLADLIPPEQVHAIPGGHDWKTWARIWRNFVQNKALQRPSTSSASAAASMRRTP